MGIQSKGRNHAATTMLALTLALALGASTARAAIAYETKDGWTIGTDGWVNAFVVSESGDKKPDGVAADLFTRNTDQSLFRMRTGFLPALIGFTLAAPQWEGLKVKARVGFYPQINNGNTRTSINPNIDTREFNFTIEGGFGQVLLGRALNVYQQKNILTDMSLFGVGVPGTSPATGTFPTLGHIGFGYLYTSFGAQIRYTTPDLGGLKIMASAADPSAIGSATITKMPTLEAEASYAGKSGSVSYQAWLGGLYQQASIDGSTPRDVTASGGSAGVGVGFAGLDLVASGFAGSGIGSAALLDGDSLDAAGKERSTLGFLGQLTYTLGKTKLGVSYGRTMVKETEQDKLERTDPVAPLAHLDNRSAITGGVYHDLTPWLKVGAEFTHAELVYFGGAKQATNIGSVGSFFFW
ncbi:MAG TPA: porin [Anaeromyxobacter sp.]